MSKLANIDSLAKVSGFLIFVISPFYPILFTYALVLLLVITVIKLIKKRSFELKWSIQLTFLTAFLAFTMVSSFWTETISEGFQLLSKLLPLLIVPILIQNTNQRSIVFIDYFIIGNLISVFTNFLYAVVNQSLNSEFLYLHYSQFMHPSYYAFFCIVAAIFALQQYINRKKIWYLIASMVLVSQIILVGSKTGIITLLSVSIIFLIKELILQRNRKILILTGISLLAIGILGYNSNRIQNFKENIYEISLDKSKLYPTESTGIRWAIYLTDIEIIKETPFFGNGTGKAKTLIHENLLKNEKRMRHLLDKKYNAHNQFLETWMENGPIAMGLLIGLLLSIRSIHKRQLWELITVGIFINYSFESMLARQSGIILLSIILALYLNPYRPASVKK